MPTITYQIRLPDHLRDDFLSACKENGLTGSSVLKQFMLDYISKASSPVPTRKKRSKVKQSAVIPSSYIETSRSNVDIPYVPPVIFDIDYLKHQREQGNFYYYDDNLIRHSVSESEYWELANSTVDSLEHGAKDYWHVLDKNELNYNISIGEPNRPRLRQLFYNPCDEDFGSLSSSIQSVPFKITQNPVKKASKKNKKRKK